MVKSNRYNPSNKKFTDHFQKLSGTKTKKGHLNEKGERDSDDVLVTNGVLVKIEKAKRNSNGWQVEVGTGSDKKTYNCVNSTGTTVIPNYTESETYFVMKEKVMVDITIDNVSKIYSITRIHGTESLINMRDDKITITDTPITNDRKQTAKVTLSQNSVQLESETIKLKGPEEANNLVEIEGDTNIYKNLVVHGSLDAPEIQDLKKENEDLKAEIEDIKEKINVIMES